MVELFFEDKNELIVTTNDLRDNEISSNSSKASKTSHISAQLDLRNHLANNFRWCASHIVFYPGDILQNFTIMSYLVNPLWPVQDSFPNQFEHDAQTISDNTHVPQSPYQTPPPTYSPRDDFASDLAIQEQAYQAQFANFLNQNFFRDIFQSGSLDSVQNRGIYNGGMVTQVSTQSNVNPSLNIEQRSNYPSASMPDISFVSPSHMERSDSSASNPGSDNVNDLLQYQWDGFGPRDGSAGQVQQVNPNSNYFIDKIEFPSGSNDHIIIELNQTPNYSTEPTGTNIIDMKSPADILYGSGGFQCVESQPSIFDPSSSSMPFISQPQSSTHVNQGPML